MGLEFIRGLVLWDMRSQQIEALRVAFIPQNQQKHGGVLLVLASWALPHAYRNSWTTSDIWSYLLRSASELMSSSQANKSSRKPGLPHQTQKTSANSYLDGTIVYRTGNGPLCFECRIIGHISRNGTSAQRLAT